MPHRAVYGTHKDYKQNASELSMPHTSLKCQCHDIRNSATSDNEVSEYSTAKNMAGSPWYQEEERTKILQKSEAAGRKKMEEKAKGRGIKLLSPREVTLYSDEVLRDNAVLEVPLQAKYTGTAPVVPPSLADTPCSELGVHGMLEHLNELLRTTYTMQQPGLSSVLQTCIDDSFDFGVAYGRLRFHWLDDFTELQSKLAAREAADKEKRGSLMDENGYIVDFWAPPRRVWDLCSNRVLPWWIMHDENAKMPGVAMSSAFGLDRPGAVSHSWMEPSLRHSVSSPINAHAWPVPIPTDTTLDRVRVELLNNTMDLVWLDVLCLRQEGAPAREALRAAEWAVDVPTIGGMYALNAINGMVLTYFSGLGRAFRVGDLGSERHWLNRAWTLQESYASMNVGGLAPRSPCPPALDGAGRVADADADVRRFYTKLEVATKNAMLSANALSAVAAMRERRAFHVVDQIGGLTYMLNRGRIPIYVRNDSPSVGEDAWFRLVDATNDTYLTHFFFLYPGRGDGKYAWCPSWKQLNGVIPRVADVRLYEKSCRTAQDAPFRYEGYVLEGCLVQGLATADLLGYCRLGTMSVDRNGTTHSFRVAAHHQHPIPEDTYVCVGNAGDQQSSGNSDPLLMHWVLGHFTPSGAFEKVSVLRMQAEEDRARLKKLKLAKRKVLDLV